MKSRILAAFAAFLMFGCAATGTAPLDTFNKKLAAGYATVQFVAEGTASAYKAGKLGENDRANVVTTTKAAIAGLDLAQSIFSATCPPGSPATCSAPAADAKVTATLAVLTALQAYLATQGAK